MSLSRRPCAWPPKLGPCYCRPGAERDNCPTCEGTGQRIDFAAVRARALAPAPAEPARLTLCGTRKVIKRAPADYRVVCATCEAGGSVRYRVPQAAGLAAVRDSARPCLECGAS